MYDGYLRRWVCPCCDKDYQKKRDLLQHLESGVHESKRYHCKGCGKKFTTLNGLQQHLHSTGCSQYSQRLANVLIRDASSAQPLMLTDRAAASVLRPEAILQFDGACQPNPGFGGAGGRIVDGYDKRDLTSFSFSTGW